MLGLVIAAVQTDEGADRGSRCCRGHRLVPRLPHRDRDLTRGRSVGKLCFGLRTVRDDAGPISFHHAFVRALVGAVEIYVFLGSPAFFAALLSPRSKRPATTPAGTYVVRERVRLQLPPPVRMPHHPRTGQRTPTSPPLPTGLALAVRQYLGRLPQLDPVSRVEVGGRLAEAVSAHVAPPPPPGTTPEAFLAAVVAARRDRDAARLARRGRPAAAPDDAPVTTAGSWSTVEA